MDEYTIPVFKSFQQQDLMFGLQKEIFIFIFLIFVIISYLFGLIPGILITTVFYIPARILTKKDPNMLSIAFNSLLEPNILEG